MFVQALKLRSAVDVDMVCFSRNMPDYYYYFIALCRKAVEINVGNPRGKLIRLIKYTTDHARKLIKHCI